MPEPKFTLHEAREELRSIRNNPANPWHEGYWKQDPEALAHVEAVYRAAVGDGQVVLDPDATHIETPWPAPGSPR